MDSGSVRAWDCCRAAQSDRHEWGISPLKWLKWLRTVANSFISQQGDEGHAKCAGVQKGKAPQCCFFFYSSFFFNVLYTWRVRRRVSVSHAAQRVAKWDWQRTVAQRRPQEGHVFSTAHSAKNIYHHAQSNLHFNMTFIKSEGWDKKKRRKKNPLIFQLQPCHVVFVFNPFLFIYFWSVLF